MHWLYVPRRIEFKLAKSATSAYTCILVHTWNGSFIYVVSDVCRFTYISSTSARYARPLTNVLGITNVFQSPEVATACRKACFCVSPFPSPNTLLQHSPIFAASRVSDDDLPSFTDLCREADNNLFDSILNNRHHVLRHLLPPPSQTSQHYSL